MTSFEALYGKKCRTPLWSETREHTAVEPEMLKEAQQQVQLIRDELKEAQSRQKSYADHRRWELSFVIGDYVYLKVSPLRGMKRFKVRGKLACHYIEPFKVIANCEEVAYQLELPPEMDNIHNVFHIS